MKTLAIIFAAPAFANEDNPCGLKEAGGCRLQTT